MHALVLGLENTFIYAGLYLLLGWMCSYVTHHYYEIALHPELATPGKTAIRWMLRAVLIYVLLGWIAGMTASASFMVHGWPWPLALAGHAAVLLLTCVLILLIVWGAFLLQSQFNAITPELMVAITLWGHVVFAMLPRARWPWRWLPGLS